MDPAILERLREQSGMRLDREGRFWHEERLVEHPKVARLFHQGLARAPDGRPTLRVGHTWCYLQVEDTLFQVRRAWCEGEGEKLRACRLLLDDESVEELDPGTLALGEEGVLYVRVKQGTEWARLSSEAQASLGPFLSEEGAGWRLDSCEGPVPVGKR